MSKTATENTLYKINKLLEIEETNDAPYHLMKQMEENKTELFQNFSEAFERDLSYDWFHDYFQEEHAERKSKKQDFTPNCIGKMMSLIVEKEGVIYEPSAGTGGIIIQHWNLHRMKYLPWELDNMKSFYVVEELSSRTIPFLIFNLAIRGINANIINCNSLTRECKEIWHLENLKIGYGYSEIIKLPRNEQAEEIFNVKFIE